MWQVIGASVRGSSHVRNNTPCQDSHLYRIVAGDVLVAAVADGLGSATRSDVGSTLAVNAALDSVEAGLQTGCPETGEDWKELLRESFGFARSTLEARATHDGVVLRELATTLLVAVFHVDWLAVGHLGDGAIVGVWGDDALTTISGPERGEYANLVLPLTSEDALSRIRFDAWPACPNSAVMMTDGLQHLALDAADVQPYPAFFLPLVRAVRTVTDPAAASRDLETFLSSERINARTDDDRTLVIIHREEAAPPVRKRRKKSLKRSK